MIQQLCAPRTGAVGRQSTNWVGLAGYDVRRRPPYAIYLNKMFQEFEPAVNGKNAEEFSELKTRLPKGKRASLLGPTRKLPLL